MNARVLVDVVVEMIVGAERNEAAERDAVREEHLRGRINPRL